MRGSVASSEALELGHVGLQPYEELVRGINERLARHYVAERRDGERFAQWVARADELVLA